MGKKADEQEKDTDTNGKILLRDVQPKQEIEIIGDQLQPT